MAVSYIVQQGPSATGPWIAVTGSPFSSASCTISGETPNTSYYVQITAQDLVLGISSTPAVFGPYTTLGNTGTAPAPAAAVNYNVQTFGPTMSFASDPTQALGGADWAPFNFFGVTWQNIVVGQSGGNLTLSTGNMGDSYGGQLCTAVYDSTQTNYMRGTAFGGGAFFEATLSFTGTPNITGVSFWANDIESMAGGSKGDLTLRQWPGQAAGYGDWIELDFPEFDTGSTTQYGQGIHNWYGTVASTQDVNTGSYPSFVSPITVPVGTDFSKSHKYGFLWVPATGSAGSPTNVFGNSALSGAVAGSPGTLWTGADATSQAGGLAFQVVSTATGVDLRMHGTATGSDCNIYLSGLNGTTTLASTTYTYSVGLALVGGSTANITGISLTSNDLDSSHGFIQGAAFSGVTLTGSVQTFTTGFTTTAATSFNTFGIDLGGPTAGQPVDITIRILNPQVLQPSGGTAGQGYAKWFFDDVQVGTTVLWNKYDSTQAPPPVQGTTAYSVMDTRHFALILGLGSSTNPVTISGVSVWQASAANNIVNNPGGTTESPSGTTVTTVGPSINASPTPGTAGQGNILTITSGGQIALNGSTLGGANVTELYYTGASAGANGATSHTAYQENSAGNWYGPITASGTGTQIAGSPIPAGPAIAISTIGSQTTNTPFSVSGTLSGYSSPPTLLYDDNAGTFGALPVSNTVSATSFTFTHPSITSAEAAATVAVEDANNTAINATSNAYAVQAVIVGAPGPPTALTSPGQTVSTITVSWAAPTTGGALNNGIYQVLYKTVAAGSYTNGPTVSYVTPGSGSFTALGGTWSVSSGGVVAFTGAGGPGTSSGVTMMVLVAGTVWQFNGTNWYGTTTPGSWPLGGNTTSPLSVTIAGLANPQSYNIEVEVTNTTGQGIPCTPISAATQTVVPTTNFSISNGKVLAPTGSTWICRGVDNYFIDNNGGAGNQYTTIADHATISSNFPGLNTFKAGLLADHTYNDVRPYITDWVTNNSCVLIIANYKYGAQYQITSSNFAADAATFSSIARGAVGNPNVWFESENEAQNGGSPGSGQTVDDEHANHYNAVRNLVQFTGTGSGTNLTVSGVNNGPILVNMVINPIANSSAVPLHTTILSQSSGTAGGSGVYVTSNATTVNNTALSAGNGNIVVFCSVAGNPFYPNSTPAQQGTASYYSNMYNVIWDDHWYGTGNGVNSTGPNDTLNAPGDFGSGASQNSISTRIAGFNNFATSLDGQIPVGAFEWGDAAAGANGPHNYGADNQQIAALKAVCNACVGNGHAGFCGQTAWQYGSYPPSVGGDVLINSGTGTRYQQSDQYAEIIAYAIANPNTVNTNNYGFVGGPS